MDESEKGKQISSVTSISGSGHICLGWFVQILKIQGIDDSSENFQVSLVQG